MRKGFPIFLVIALSLLSLWYVFLGVELIPPMALDGPVKLAAWALLALPFGAIAWLPLVYWRRRNRGNSQRPATTPPIVSLAYLSLGLLSFLFALVIARGLVHASIWTLHLVTQPGWLIALLQSDLAFGGKSSFCLIGLSVVFLLVGLREGGRLPRLKEIVVPIDGLDPQWEGFRIVQLSDLHVGHSIRKAFVERVVAAANSLKPDIVALTGDMVDGTPDDLRSEIEPLSRLTPKDGTYYVTGNHEYYWGAAAWTEEMRKIGVTPLINTHHVLERGGKRLLVAGVSDISSGHYPGGTVSDPKAAMAGAPESSVRLLLAHQPKTALKAEAEGYDLQLSGHTHGGQFIPWTFIIRFFHPFWRGLGRCNKMWVYVSRGTGFWGPPLRLGAPSEITLLRLMRREV